jgi:hypothetical protein
MVTHSMRRKILAGRRPLANRVQLKFNLPFVRPMRPGERGKKELMRLG